MEKIVQVFNAGKTNVFGGDTELIGVLTSKGRIFVQTIIDTQNGNVGSTTANVPVNQRYQCVWMEMPSPDLKVKTKSK